jgi:hypothetical protein
MDYMILIYQDSPMASMPADAPVTAPWVAYTQALIAAGVMVGGSRLAPPSTATMVQVRDGKRLVQDGPYADTKEQLAGYYLIKTPDLDAALDWAAKCPGALSGKIEVRPLAG